jgi:hypothetical protein
MRLTTSLANILDRKHLASDYSVNGCNGGSCFVVGNTGNRWCWTSLMDISHDSFYCFSSFLLCLEINCECGMREELLKFRHRE